MSYFTQETTNHVIWHPSLVAGHVESYFMKMNDTKAQTALWVKYTIYSPKGDPGAAKGECWAIFFDVNNPENNLGIKEQFPLSECEFSSGSSQIKFGGNTFVPGKTKGKLTNPEGKTIEWDINFTTDSDFLEHFPHPKMYTAKIPKSKAVTPFTDEKFSGVFKVDGKEHKLNKVPGMQGHNWGSEHAHRYAWAHCNAFEGMPGTWFEGLSARVKMGPITSPFLSLAFVHHEGRTISFNSPGAIFSRNVRIEHTEWRFEMENADYHISGKIGAPSEYFCGLKYYNPTGVLSYCLNSKVSDAEITLLPKSGGKRLVLKSNKTTALETLTKQDDHGIIVYC